jgi:hypothetical protein
MEAEVVANVLNKLSDFISGRNSYDESEDDGYYDDDQEDDAQTGSRALPAPSGKSSRPASSYESNIFSINTNV